MADLRVHAHPTLPVLVTDYDPTVARIPDAEVVREGQSTFVALPWGVKHTVALRALGYDAPSPIYRQYRWAGVTPFEAQTHTAALMSSHTRAYCLNDMGTGKTLATLFSYDYLRQRGAVNKMLIVAPLSTLGVVWESEVFRRMPHYTTAIVHGTKRQRLKKLALDVDIYIVNHDGLKTLSHVPDKRTKRRVLIDALRQRDDIDVLCIDELAVFRNHTRDRWKAAHALVSQKGWRFVWGLTGSPTPNKPTDVWAQCKLLTPETVPEQFETFRSRTMYQAGFHKWESVSDAAEVAYNAMRPAVRFSRGQCVDLPPTTISTRAVRMSDAQMKAYEQMRKDFVVEHDSGEITAVNAAVQLTKLLQISTGFVYGEDGAVKFDNKDRLGEVMEIIDQSSSKVVVFVPFIEALHDVSEYLMQHGITNEVVYGAVPQKDRTTIFNKFQNEDDPRVLVAHPKVAAHGLTLTRADTIVWYSVLHDFEVVDQACARIARPGQTLNTHIIYLVGTQAEKRVADALQRKEQMQNTILDLFQSDDAYRRLIP